MGLREKPDEKAVAPDTAPEAPLTLSDKIRKLGAERQMDSALVDLLLAIADKLELLGKALAR